MISAVGSTAITALGGPKRVRADIDSVMSSSDRITPPCTVPQLVVKSGLISSDRRATPFSSASMRTPRCSAKRIFLTNSAISGETALISRVSDQHGAAVDGDRLARDVARGVRSEQHGEPLQVLRPAEAPRGRGLADQLSGRVERRRGHLRRKEARTDRVHGDAVHAPFGGELLGEAD